MAAQPTAGCAVAVPTQGHNEASRRWTDFEREVESEHALDFSNRTALRFFSLDTPHPSVMLNSRRRSPNQPPMAGKDIDIQESDRRSPEGRCAWSGRNRIDTLLDQLRLGPAFLVNRTPEVAAEAAPNRGVFATVCAVDANVCVCVLEHVSRRTQYFSESSPILGNQIPSMAAQPTAPTLRFRSRPTQGTQADLGLRRVRSATHGTCRSECTRRSPSESRRPRRPSRQRPVGAQHERCV